MDLRYVEALPYHTLGDLSMTLILWLTSPQVVCGRLGHWLLPSPPFPLRFPLVPPDRLKPAGLPRGSVPFPLYWSLCHSVLPFVYPSLPFS